jgi:hypothetical protein
MTIVALSKAPIWEGNVPNSDHHYHVFHTCEVCHNRSRYAKLHHQSYAIQMYTNKDFWQFVIEGYDKIRLVHSTRSILQFANEAFQLNELFQFNWFTCQGIDSKRKNLQVGCIF